MAKQARRKAQPQKKNNQLFLWSGLGLIVMITVVWILISRNSNTGTDLPSEISIAEALTKRDSGAFILDVRQPEEWNEAHIPNSTLIPLDQLPNRINELPEDKEIVVICRSGNRSAQGRDLLLEAGGLKQWQAAGYPTVSGP